MGRPYKYMHTLSHTYTHQAKLFAERLRFVERVLFATLFIFLQHSLYFCLSHWPSFCNYYIKEVKTRIYQRSQECILESRNRTYIQAPGELDKTSLVSLGLHVSCLCSAHEVSDISLLMPSCLSGDKHSLPLHAHHGRWLAHSPGVLRTRLPSSSDNRYHHLQSGGGISLDIHLQIHLNPREYRDGIQMLASQRRTIQENCGQSGSRQRWLVGSSTAWWSRAWSQNQTACVQWLCALEQITELLCGSVSSPVT